MSKLYYIIAAFLLMPLCCAQASQNTNLQVLENLYFDIFQDALASISLSDSSGVIEKSATTTDYNWVIEKQLFAYLTTAGLRQVYSDAEIEHAARVRFNSIKQDIFYQKLKGKQTARQIDIELHVHLVDSKKNILQDEIFERTFTDTLLTKEIKNSQDVKYPFTIGKKNQSFLQKIYEPVLVTMITGWIIYLFYSYRSQ